MTFSVYNPSVNAWVDMMSEGEDPIPEKIDLDGIDPLVWLHWMMQGCSMGTALYTSELGAGAEIPTGYDVG